MSLSAYNPSTKTFYENDATKPLDSDDLVQALADSRAIAVPAATGQLLGGSGTAGTASPVTVGSGLSLASGTLTATGGSGGTVPLANIAQGGATSNQALVWNGAVWTPTSLSAGTTYTFSTGLTNTAGTITVNFGGLGSAATVSHSDHTHSIYASIANNLSDLANVGTARGNLGLGNIATLAGTAQGQVAYYNGSAWTVLAPGAAGFVLSTNGAGANPTWVAQTVGSGGSTGYGTPTIISASGAQAITLTGTRTFIKLQNTTGVTNLTLPPGTADGQLFLLEVVPTSQLHTIAGTFFEAAETLSVNSPNEGVAMHAVWSASQNTWLPMNYNGGYNLGDLAAVSALAGADITEVVQSGVAKRASMTQLATFSLLNIPSWTTGARPSVSGSQYAEGYNTTTGRFECWNGTTWYNTAKLTGDTFTGAVAVAPVALTDGASISTNAALGNLFTVVLGGNRTLANPTNLVSGQFVTFQVTQDGTGSRTLAYGNMFTWPGGTAPTLSTAANAVDAICCYYDGSKLRCQSGKAFA